MSHRDSFGKRGVESKGRQDIRDGSLVKEIEHDSSISTQQEDASFQ